jgi:hypothetical protein
VVAVGPVVEASVVLVDEELVVVLVLEVVGTVQVTSSCGGWLLVESLEVNLISVVELAVITIAYVPLEVTELLTSKLLYWPLDTPVLVVTKAPSAGWLFQVRLPSAQVEVLCQTVKVEVDVVCPHSCKVADTPVAPAGIPSTMNFM